MSNTITERLQEWVKQQPEYPLLFLANRRTRRRASVLLARVLFTMPTPSAEGLNRKGHRQLLAEVKTHAGKQRTKLSRRQQRQLTQAIRMRNRFGRMSVRRMEELARREAARRAEMDALEAAQEVSEQAEERAALDRELMGVGGEA